MTRGPPLGSSARAAPVGIQRDTGKYLFSYRVIAGRVVSGEFADWRPQSAKLTAVGLQHESEAHHHFGLLAGSGLAAHKRANVYRT